MKYAIVESGGKQYKAVEGGIIEVDRLPVEPGSQLDLERVLLLVDGNEITVGTPIVTEEKVKTTVLDHFKGRKIVAFRYRPKKRIRVKSGHRQHYTRLQVDQVGKPSMVEKPTKVEEPVEVGFEVKVEKVTKAEKTPVKSAKTEAARKPSKPAKVETAKKPVKAESKKAKAKSDKTESAKKPTKTPKGSQVKKTTTTSKRSTASKSEKKTKTTKK